jgi:serine/threonine protein kinase
MAATRLDEQAIFEVARKIDSREAREAYLQQVCGDNTAIGLRVRTLLKAYEESASFLESPAVPLVATLDEPIAEHPGTVIGPYKLLEQIGEGGFGVVFMAEQEKPLRRKVAVKVLKPGMDTRQVVARFEAERQALALMDHVNIAKVFDAGTTASGRPYFVMELVRGVPITEFCDQYRFTPRQRLELFVTVCQAVQHAHQKGIIHRDLKPSNVLVTLHDVVAVPKVIDFGIAKAMQQKLTERTLFTHFAQMIGTPLYMSPEQAEMNSLDVDTRSDVYALGVLLYELLTGTTPFESETLKKVGLDEMRRIIREEEPPTPSQRLNTLDARACSTVSERRGVDGRHLGQVLRGELDWIVMKALEKDRNRRYESASALAADVQRYLSDEPVAACPPSAGYRLRKYWRRNRRWLVTAGVVAGALLAATAVSIWQAARATEAQHQAETDRKQAEADKARAQTAEERATTEASIAKAVADFLQHDLLRQVDSDPQLREELSGNPNLTVKEALDRAAAKIGERFADQPLVEAAIRTVIANAYQSLPRQHQLAVSHLERAAALRQAHLGPDHPDTLASMDRLANAYSEVSRDADAIALYQRILEKRRQMLGPDHPETLACLSHLAAAYCWGRQFDQSVRLYEQVLEKQRTICGPTHPETLDTMLGLAEAYRDGGRLAEALALYERLLDSLKSTHGPVSPSNYLEIFHFPMVTFARACQRAGELDRAERLLREALAILQKRKPSPFWRAERAKLLAFLANNMYLKQHYAEAEPLIREALTLWEEESVPNISYGESLLGAVLLGQQRYAEAEPLILQGYKGVKRREADQHFAALDIIEAGERVVRFYEETNQPEKARAWRERLREDKSKK